MTRANHIWTPEESARLMFLWESRWSLSGIARRMQRTESAVYRQAQKLKLSIGCPDGCEYIEAASRRAGVCPKTLFRILRFAKVKVYKSLSDPAIKRKGCYRRWYVDKEDVDDAVAAWTRSESVYVAAVRLGIPDDTLRRWLRDAGKIDGVEHGSRKHQRVESSVIDEVVARHRAEHQATAREKNARAARIRWERAREKAA